MSKIFLFQKIQFSVQKQFHFKQFSLVQVHCGLNVCHDNLSMAVFLFSSIEVILIDEQQ